MEMYAYCICIYAFVSGTLLYLHCHRDDTASAATQLEWCVADFSCWMSWNRLKLNTDKTELLWVEPRYSLHQHDFCLPELHLDHDSVIVVPHYHVCLLGPTILSDLSFNRNVPSSVPQAYSGLAAATLPAFTQHSWQQYSSIHSCCQASTTVTLFWRVYQKWRLTSFNE